MNHRKSLIYLNSAPILCPTAVLLKITYTTHAVVSLNWAISKTLNTRGSLSTRRAKTKLVFLAVRNFGKDGRVMQEWVAASNQLVLMLTDRFSA